MRAIMAGDIHLSSIGMGSVSGQLNSNRMKVLAIEGASRSPSLPDVPTFAESGFDAYPIKAWWGLLAPAGVPDSIIQKVSAEIKDIYANQKFMDTNFQQQFLQPAFLSGDEFGGFMKTDRELATQLFKKLNLQQE